MGWKRRHPHEGFLGPACVFVSFMLFVVFTVPPSPREAKTRDKGAWRIADHDWTRLTRHDRGSHHEGHEVHEGILRPAYVYVSIELIVVYT